MDTVTLFTQLVSLAQVITALAAVAALVIGFRQLKQQLTLAADGLKHTEHLHEISLVLKFDEKFESERMRSLRKKAAEFLRLRPPPAAGDPRWHELSEFIDFFQIVGTAMALGHIRVEVVYKWFSYWYLHYYPRCADYIKSQQKDSPITWADAVELYKQLRDFDLLKNRGAFSNLSEGDLNAFFEWELETL